jgi:hypothetical protein
MPANEAKKNASDSHAPEHIRKQENRFHYSKDYIPVALGKFLIALPSWARDFRAIDRPLLRTAPALMGAINHCVISWCGEQHKTFNST